MALANDFAGLQTFILFYPHFILLHIFILLQVTLHYFLLLYVII